MTLRGMGGGINGQFLWMQRLALDKFKPQAVVYSWGTGCNRSTQAALKLSRMGYAVKEMIGVIEYWERVGYPAIKAK